MGRSSIAIACLFVATVSCAGSSKASVGTIEMKIVTGNDDLRDNSEAQAIVSYKDGSEDQIELKTNSDGATWPNGFVFDSGAIPIHSAAGVDHVVLSMVSHPGAFQSDDNWQVSSVQISVALTGGALTCVANAPGGTLNASTSESIVAGTGCP